MKYKITKLLNNNALICRDQANEEIIIRGKGIAYNSIIGDFVEEEKIEKIFILSTPEIKRKYQELIVSIPNDICDISIEIIEYIHSKIDKKLSDNLYVTLTDHISNLIERLQYGYTFDNAILWDVKRIYKNEYKIGREVVDMLVKQFDLKIDKDEACFIALHIVNAELNEEIHATFEVTALIEDILDIVASDFDIEFDLESISYSRFILHLRVFFERILIQESLKTEKSSDLLLVLSQKYPQQYDCVLNIIKFISKKYDEVYDGEILYLLVHVIKLTEQD